MKRFRNIFSDTTVKMLLMKVMLLASVATIAQTPQGVVVHGNVYGGGNQADVKINTEVNMSTGKVEGNVYGGGNIGSVGTYTTSADMKTFTFTANTGTCNVTINNGTIGTGVSMSQDGTFANGNVYGAGKGEDDTYWCEKAMVYKTNLTINGGTVNGTVYGGGQIGRVENNATVIIGVETPANETPAPTIAGNVFGAGAGKETHGYSALLRGDAKLTIQGNARIGLNVYGGGEEASVGRFKIVGGLPSEPEDDGSGDCTVNVRGNAVIGTNTDENITDKGNVFGTCKGVAAPTTFTEYDKNYKSMQAVAQKAPEGTELTDWDWVDGSENVYYWKYYPTLDAYQGFLNTLALASHPVVTIGGTWNETTEAVTASGTPTVNGSVYGGGQRGITLGTVAVNIAGGTVNHDVYGGGALADTNKGNQTAEKYDEETVAVGETVVTGMYERSGDVGNYTYTLVETADQKAETGKTYYTRAAQSSIHPTTVNLTGGTIHGDAYGGGLGQKTGFNGATSNIEATVWGDIAVTLGSSGGSTATAFHVNKYTDEGHVGIVKSGRIFGCNNLLGSPKGDVTVRVWKTVAGNIQRTASETKASNKTIITNHPDDYETTEGFVAPTYEVATVYGGGNLADYTATGKKTNVIIETCDVSIRDVYGGGNAAKVPETDVLVKGAYEIQEVFGGGNGKDPYKNDNGWVVNPGADIDGNANTLLTGGYVHEAYGGSNEKGTITGNVTIDVGTGGACDLDVEKMVGAGKNADVNGDLIMILGCKPSTKIPLLYAGADNANVNGDVELTITSGRYGKVFGGNNMGGIILGHIKLNIEETGDCETPIEIDELYLGGNQAMYSQYGYYKDGDTYKGRTAEMAAITDPAATGYQAALTDEDYGTTIRKTTLPYDAPELNVISCTYIGQVFGGGFGEKAVMYGNPKVNINMIAGAFANDIHTFMANDSRLTALSLPSTENTENLGIIGTVYGGGNAADVVGDPTVNIGTASTVTLVSTGNTQNVVGAYITGNVFGGGKGEADNFLCNKAMIGADGAGLLDADGDGELDKDGGTTVNIFNGFVRGNVYGGGQIGRVEKNTVVTIGTGDGVAPGGTPTSAPIILGSVYGGGAGEEEHGYAALVRGNPTVTIQGNAKVRHSVYGGGEIASVARYNVPKTEGEVQQAIAEGYTEAALGMPYALKDASSGTCTVIVRGYAEIGPETAMQMTREGGPDDTGYVFGAGKGILPGGEYEYAIGTTRRMVLYDATVHTSGTQGTKWQWVDYPNHSESNNNVWEYFANLDEYIKFIQTLALSSRTDVTITGNAFVKGSVYGGSENGIVQFDTEVKIQGGQIGAGDGMNEPYAETDWAGTTTPSDGWKECASWLFQEPYAPYDPYATNLYNGQYYYDSNHTQEAAGGASVATDGHTYYGNVFGGGSGSVPYFDHTLGRSVYLHSAGQVKGDTHVTISGGHILTNVYGGCEATNVEGSANVTMTDGTIGVPRTDTQIIAHPLTGYIFGGGKGDQRIFFNKDTNVKDAVVTVEGGRIYGSVYGGGEDGHVMRNVTLTIGKQTQTTGANDQVITTTSGPTIGTEGTSYYDGHVFGGGRGFGGDALTAGNVGGSVDMNILGGSILGSVYGGGRLASVGYGLYLVDEEVEIGGETVKPYGTMRPDDVYDNPSKPTSTETAAAFFNKGRGHINMTISGGTIGNDNEYAYDANNQLSHTKGGNVFAGGMGRMYKLDGTTPISSLDWWKLGCVKSTKLTISGDAKIYSCVYGGGELGQVVGYHTAKNASNADVNVGTEVIINGGAIGYEVKDGSNVVQYTFGSVFGGGYGSLVEVLGTSPKISYPKYIAGRVMAGTKVNMTAGTVLASVYGGGEMAAVGESTILGETLTTGYTGDTHVMVSGGIIGKNPITLSDNSIRYFGGAKMGNVYGGGSGHNNTVRSGHVYGNTNVTINEGSVSGEPKIYHNIYGGGAYGSVGDFVYTTTLDSEAGVQKVSGITGLHTERTNTGTANVTIKGGTIGYDGKENGMVFGSSRGDINELGARDDYTAWVYNANVTIGVSGTPAQGTEGEVGYVPATDDSGPNIKGSVYGSGENGHTFNNTVVTVNGGTIGIASNTDPGYTVTSNDKQYAGAAYPYRGNVYGGGCGTDKYYSDHSLENHSGAGDFYNALAGIVYGTTTVNINGGTVVRNVYGAGAMGSVGKTTWTTTTTNTNNVETTTKTAATTTGGSTTVNINGGIIGVNGSATVGDGNVFGAARGSKDIVQADQDDLSKVSVTNVIVSGGLVKGNVYGGGELGDVGTIAKNTTNYNYTWMASGGSGANTPLNNGITENNTNTGICNVTITGGIIGSTTAGGNVFGGGKGDANTWWCEKAMAFATKVSISESSGSTTKVYGTVYGGGEIGRVEDDSKVIIGTANGSDTPEIVGNVFGAGKGLATRGYSALVRGNSVVTIQGSAQVGGNVFGGGEEASLGKFVLDGGLPKSPLSGGRSAVTIQDHAIIGSSGTNILTHHVYGAGQGVTPNYDTTTSYKNYKSMQLEGNKPSGSEGDTWDYYLDDNNKKDTRFVWVYYKTEPEYQAFLNTLALASHPTVTIAENAIVYGDVYGGGQRGITMGDVEVNITGGTVKRDVYGGGSLADTNKGNWEDSQNAWAEGKYDSNATCYKTNVTLTGGEIDRNVYGGGLGQLAKDAVAAVLYTASDPEVIADPSIEGTVKIPAVAAVSAVEAKVYGDVLVKLNEDTANDNCEVKGTIFGCNNLNGSPQSGVTVHVYKTVRKVNGAVQEKAKSTYEVTAVYGGGNLSAFKPDYKATADTVLTRVIIDGCDLTSIGSVYGGGNAASVPATDVVVNATYEIGELFGGGNGKEDVSYDGGVTYVTNPGANVGYLAYPDAENHAYDTKENRITNYGYGLGKAHATVYGGTVNSVYGGSNTKGNIRVEARATLEEASECDFNIDEAYGGGRNAPMDGDAVLDIGCIRGMERAYGGAADADVNGDVVLNINNGTYSQVFGGNDAGGAIRGSITVNIQETGCNPIVIGELYGGGNQAPYSVYGYYTDDQGKAQPLTSLPQGATKQRDPQVNVYSFTSIGTIYGGGLGASAIMVGDPTVNIDVYEGLYAEEYNHNANVIGENAKVVGSTVKKPGDSGYESKGYPVPSHEKGAIGAIGTVFGGGNAAEVKGNTIVNVGTRLGEDLYEVTPVAVGASVQGYYTLTAASGTAVANTTYYQKNGNACRPVTVAVGASVQDYYTLTAASGTAVANTTYCQKKTFKGVDIRGDVFGAGNNARVTGNTNVTIGKSTVTP